MILCNYEIKISTYLPLRLRKLFSLLLIIIWVIGPLAQSRSFAQGASYIKSTLTSRKVFQQFKKTNVFYSPQKLEDFFHFPKSQIVDQIAPTVQFIGLRHYVRISNQIAIQVQANDDVGISRIELYIDGVLFDTHNIVPNTPNALVTFIWNTTITPNGKHLLQAKAFDVAGNVQTATLVVLNHNTSTSLPTPTATLTASPSSIISGQSATLTWTTTNATSVTINQGIGTVLSNGSLTVSPSVNTTYTLTATNSTGFVTKTANVTITPLTGNNIIVLPAIRYQTMGGWEATAQAGQLESPAWDNYKNALFDQAVNDLGLNRIRAEITSGAENPVDYFAQWRAGQITISQYSAKVYEIINDNSNPNVINPNGFKWSQLDSTIDTIVLPMRQRLQARGETLWLSINYVDFGSSTFEHKNNPSEYAEFVLATYQHLQSRYGFVPDSWEVILEPDTSSASWSATQVAQAIKAAGDLLVANNFTPNFVAPSTTDTGNASVYIDQIAQTPGAMQYVGEFSYHRYSGASGTTVQNIASRATQYNKRTAMLEWIGADYLTLHDDLKTGRISSWQQYTLGFPNEPDNGAQYYLINDTNQNNPTLTIGSRTKLLRQYFKYIRGGAQRIEALTGNSSFDPLAFINTNGKYVVVVKANSGGSFSIQGLPAGTYGIKYTTNSQYNVDLTDITIGAGQSLTTNIPATGVITIYAR